MCNSHQGKDCVRAGECGENGRRRSHHKFLRPSEEFGNRKVSSKAESVSNPSSPSSRTLTTVTSDVTEGNTEQATDEHLHITTLTSAQYQEFVSLRTVPVWLSAKGKKIKVNTVLDDACTVSHVNEEVAGALGLSATYEKLTVNVLNENVETFDSMAISLILESCDGNVKVLFKALTCPRRVTGSYKIVDWQEYQDRGPHLSVCKFSHPAADPIVDVLIAQDQLDLHFSKCDVRGNSGEPLARLRPLGWSCVGHSGKRTLLETRERI